MLGGGFAGSYVARGLGRSGATIVNPTNFILYTPLLPEAAGGSVEPRHVTVPLRTMCPHADLVLGVFPTDRPEQLGPIRIDADGRVVAVQDKPASVPDDMRTSMVRPNARVK